MKKILAFLGLLVLGLAHPVFAGEYTRAMTHDLNRSVKNLVAAPVEIPVTIQKYHEQAGPPVFRQMAGFVDGFFRTITRFGSGAWDAFAAFTPGMQEGFPPEPETFF